MEDGDDLKDILKSYEGALKAAREMLAGLSFILSVFPKDRDVIRMKSEVEELVRRYKDMRDDASKNLSSQVSKKMPESLLDFAKDVGGELRGRLVNRSDLKVSYGTRMEYRGLAYYARFEVNVGYRVQVGVVFALPPHGGLMMEMNGLRMSIVSVSRPSEFVDEFIDGMRGWDGLKG